MPQKPSPQASPAPLAAPAEPAPARGTASRGTSSALAPEARRRRARGDTLREIGEALGLAHTQVRRVLAAGPEPEPAPAPAPGALAAELEAFAVALETAGGAGPAALVRRAVAALAAPPVEPPDLPSVDPTAPAIDHARGLLASLQRMQAEEEAIGNRRGAAYAARTLGSVLPLLGRLERAARDESDGFWTSYSDLARAKAAAAERVRKILEAGPLMCARCGADLRREAATG